MMQANVLIQFLIFELLLDDNFFHFYFCYTLINSSQSVKLIINIVCIVCKINWKQMVFVWKIYENLKNQLKIILYTFFQRFLITSSFSLLIYCNLTSLAYSQSILSIRSKTSSVSYCYLFTLIICPFLLGKARPNPDVFVFRIELLFSQGYPNDCV